MLQHTKIIRDLHTPNPSIFWTDLLLTTFVGWSAFAAAVITMGQTWSVLAILVSALALYRALCFVHEISHLRPGAVRGFNTVWNLLVGVPLLLPSFAYAGVHSDHHKTSTYGTIDDPEYLPFARSDLMMVGFIAHSILIPLFQVLRFIIAAPIALLVPSVHKWLGANASALSMNMKYRRSVSSELLATMRRWELVITVFWWGVFALAFTGRLPWHAFFLWYVVAASIALVNTLRTLGAHKYEGSGSSMTRKEQLLDSIDTPGAALAELWAPVGLRYHALHHYFPGVPYHNLPEAYRRLVASLPSADPLRQVASPSLPRSLSALYRTGRQVRQGRTSLHADAVLPASGAIQGPNAQP